MILERGGDKAMCMGHRLTAENKESRGKKKK
jgi:hypothetical protein